MKTYWGNGGIASRILSLDTRCNWVVSFAPPLLYPRERTQLSYYSHTYCNFTCCFVSVWSLVSNPKVRTWQMKDIWGEYFNLRKRK